MLLVLLCVSGIIAGCAARRRVQNDNQDDHLFHYEMEYFTAKGEINKGNSDADKECKRYDGTEMKFSRDAEMLNRIRCTPMCWVNLQVNKGQIYLASDNNHTSSPGIRNYWNSTAKDGCIEYRIDEGYFLEDCSRKRYLTCQRQRHIRPDETENSKNYYFIPDEKVFGVQGAISVCGTDGGSMLIPKAKDQLEMIKNRMKKGLEAFEYYFVNGWYLNNTKQIVTAFGDVIKNEVEDDEKQPYYDVCVGMKKDLSFHVIDCEESYGVVCQITPEQDLRTA